MKEEKNIIASTESSEVYKIDSAEYIIRRTKEVMKNYPHLDMCRIMDDVKDCFARDKEVFDSIKQDTRLYKRIVLFGESVEKLRQKFQSEEFQKPLLEGLQRIQRIYKKYNNGKR